MAYNIRPSLSFEPSLEKLDKSIAKRVTEKLEMLAENPLTIPSPMGNLPKDLTGLRKIRVGNWRVFFWVDHAKKEIVPYFIENRDEIYKWLYRRK